MRLYFRNTAFHTIVYSLGNIGTKMIGLLLLPLYTSVLDTSDYGLLAYFEVSVQLLIAILSLGFPTAIIRFCANEVDFQKRKQIIFTILIITLSTLALVLAVMWNFRLQLSMGIFQTPAYQSLISIVLLTVFFEVQNILALSIMRLNEQSKFYVVVVLSKFALILLLNVYFLVYLKMGVKGILISQLIGSILLFIVTTNVMIKSSVARFNRTELKAILKYSLPLLVSASAAMLLNISDRYIVEYLLDFSQLGIYSLGYKFASVINIFVIQSFQLGFMPIAFKIFSDKDSNKFFARLFTYLALILLVFALVLSFFSIDVIRLMADNRDFWNANAVIPILCISFVFKGMQYIPMLSIHFAKKTHLDVYVVLAAGLVNVGLNFLLIPQMGIMGTAVAAALTSALLLFFYMLLCRRLYPIPWESGRLVKLFLLAGVALILAVLPVVSGLLQVFYKLLLLALFAASLYVSRFFFKSEMGLLKGLVKKWQKPADWFSNFKELKL